MLKRNLPMFFMYLVIFLSVSLMIQVSVKESGGGAEFQEKSLNIAVIDRDGGELARGLQEYLGERHNLVDIPDDRDVIQEALFYRNIFYVVTIPEDFEKVCLEGEGKLETTKIPGTTSAFYVDQQIDTFLNCVRIYIETDYSLEEAMALVTQAGESETQVTLLDKSGHGGEIAFHTFMFRYMPYIIFSIICYVITAIMIAFRKKDVKRRMLCSALPARSQNRQLVFGFLAVGAIVWIICMLLPLILYGKELLNDANLGYFLLNAFILTLVALGIAYTLGVLLEDTSLISNVVNVITLGMSFLCGVFVPLEILGKGVRTFAQFLPVYWYEVVNDILARNVDFTSAQRTTIWQGYGIQVLFAVAIFAAGMIVSKLKEQE